MIEKQRFNNFLYWLTSFKITKLIYLLLILLISILILNHFRRNEIAQNKKNFNQNSNQLKHNQFYEKYNLNDFKDILKQDNLEQRIGELFKIRESILNELVYLENNRKKQQEEITNYAIKLDEIKSQIVHKQNELTRIHLSLEQAEYSQKEVILKNRPFISNPLKIIDNNNLFQINLTKNSIQTTDQNNFKNNRLKRCSMHHCFDYSKCPLTKKLNVYLDFKFLNQLDDKDAFTRLLKTNLIKNSEHNFNLIENLDKACLILIPILNRRQINLIENNLFNKTNVLIINFDLIENENESMNDNELKELPNQFMIANNDFFEYEFRNKFDLILPSFKYIRQLFKSNQLITSTVKNYLHCPAKRKYLVSCIDNLYKDDQKINLQLVQILNGIFNNSINKFDNFYLNFNYTKTSIKDKNEIYSQSTFTLILPDNDLNKISSEQIHQQLASILSTNSIPILLGDYQIELPFNEVLDWNLAVIKLPLARVSEIHLIIKSFSDNDILKMRKYGKLFYERYLSVIEYVIQNIYSIFKSKRLQFQLNPIKDDYSDQIYDKDKNRMHLYEINTDALENTNDLQENLGPIGEPAFPSITYQRNYSLILTETYNLWNSDQLNPFFMFPYSPFDPILPSEAKFKGSSYGFRPINQGLGGSGKEFSENIGGNYQKEQFTILILTYNRESILMDSLQRLKGLPYLNKIVIIWNSKDPPDPEIKWPDVGVEIAVIKAEKNSLNNRFKPYDIIETEAILSMDDDVHLRADEIIFGFRVWRESKERIVGFPGRYHAWSQNEWFYNSNYSCELSMVLTGAAFFHKYYSYVYTNLMDSLIRDKVDEYMNCEDIAFNFLVSHLTRKPPLKVTSRWTFRCLACPISLSEDDSHFEERHRCINYFTSLYGYNPLLYTQFRLDSVLFKTRIPQNKQKCFKLI